MTAATFSQVRGTHPPLRRLDGPCRETPPCRPQTLTLDGGAQVKVHDRTCDVYADWWRHHDLDGCGRCTDRNAWWTGGGG